MIARFGLEDQEHRPRGCIVLRDTAKNAIAAGRDHPSDQAAVGRFSLAQSARRWLTAFSDPDAANGARDIEGDAAKVTPDAVAAYKEADKGAGVLLDIPKETVTDEGGFLPRLRPGAGP